ncbi:MAG: hypothetical protein IIZ66_02775 [Clostridia bacterium]|nr:hypothetical protein [Clostridia bacterium]
MKLLCVGNSMTLHPPKEDIGWAGCWGMAASAQEKDYAHRLAAKLEEAGKTVELRAADLVELEREPESFPAERVDELLAFGPDAVVIRLGENVPDEKAYGAYIRGYGEVIDRFLSRGVRYLFAVGNFWERDDLDALTASLAAKKGVPFVSLKDIQGERNQAIGEFENAGVAAHPSDKGMQAIADEIFASFVKSGMLDRAAAYPVPDGEPVYEGMRVTLDGVEAQCYRARVSAVPFNRVWPGHQRPLEQTELAPFISFDMTAPVDVTVSAGREVGEAVVRPLAKGIVPRVEDGKVSFTVREPGQYSLELDGRHHNLHLFANAAAQTAELEREAETATYSFGPGVHRLGERIRLKSGESVYIAPGAVVYGDIEATDARDVRVFGGGVLDGSLIDRNDSCCDMRREGLVHFTRCKGVVTEGVTLRDSCLWTVTCINCENLLFRNVKVIGMWRYNADGFDFVNSRNAVVSGCFLRTFDDTVVLKGLCLGDRSIEKMNMENYLIENCVLWCDWGGAMEVGAETVCDEYVNIAWKNCDIIRTDQGAMRLHCGDRAYVHNVSYDGIRVEYSKYDRKSVYQRSDDMVYDPGDEPAHDDLLRCSLECGLWSPDMIAGNIRDVVCRDITVYKDEEVSSPACRFNGFDERHTIERVRLENVTLDGAPFVPELIRNAFTADITAQ